MKLKTGRAIHEVIPREDGVFDVDGVRVQARVEKAADAGFIGKSGDRTASVFVARDRDRVFAQVGDRAYTLTAVSRAAALGAMSAPPPGGLEAPMPGRITRLGASAGDLVKRGQELIVVEAMKMENAITAPFDGVVKELSVKLGDMVAPGVPLIVIEER